MCELANGIPAYCIVCWKVDIKLNEEFFPDNSDPNDYASGDGELAPPDDPATGVGYVIVKGTGTAPLQIGTGSRRRLVRRHKP